MSETADYDKSATPTAHKTTHQDGGSDEISVQGLAGLLAGEQLSTWDAVSEKPDTYPPDHHHESHEVDGDDIVTRPDVLPAGGTAGQILAKIDADDYHTEWIDAVIAAFGLIPATLLMDILSIAVTMPTMLTTSVTLS
jgi:hypothetical protein